MEEFFTDMKKRRLAPSYDPRMVERLSNLSCMSGNQSHGGSASSGYSHAPVFNPRSVSFDIHTPEELAAVNEFLITLGREVTTTTRAHTVPARHPAREFDDHPSHSYFNPAGLSELGLTGMPGIMNSAAGSGSSFSDGAMFSTSAATGFPPYHSRSAHQPVPVPGINFAAPQPTSLFPDVPMPFFPDLTTRRESSAFSSTVSTPSSMSNAKLESPPPLANRTVGYQSPETLSPHFSVSTPPTSVDFDFLRTSRGPPPVAQITTHDYHPTRTMRPILKSVPAEYKNRTEQASSKPLKPIPTDKGSGSDNLHHLLTSGSQECTLAPLHIRECSSSPPTSPPRSDTSTPEPQYHEKNLPSLKSVTSGISTERLASDVRDIEIESQTDEDEIRSMNAEEVVDEPSVKEEQRQEHARLIKELLVYINSEYKKRYGVPGERGKDRLVRSRTLMGPGVPGIQRPPSSMDVEMAVV